MTTKKHRRREMENERMDVLWLFSPLTPALSPLRGEGDGGGGRD